MKKKLTLMISILLFATNFITAQTNEPIIGKWEYKVSSAPYGYEKGELNIVEKEKKLSGEVKFTDGYKIKLKELNLDNNKLSIGLYIDYEYVKISAKINNNKIEGTVHSSLGKMKLTAKKIVSSNK